MRYLQCQMMHILSSERIKCKKNLKGNSDMKRMREEFEQLHCGTKVVMKIIFFVALGALLWYLVIPRTMFFFRKPAYLPILGGLNSYDIVLEVGETYHLYIFDINKRVSFQSSDIKVATVNLIGTVKAWRPGTTVIKVRYEKKELKCRVRVVKLSKEKLTLKVGQTKRLYVKYVAFGARFYSNNPGVVSVNRFGRVKAVGKGTAVITVSYRGKKMTCKIKVYGK